MKGNGSTSGVWTRLAVVMLACLCIGSQAFAQDPGMGPDGGPGGQPPFDPNNPPVKPTEPVKPIKPKPLELDMDWMEVRDKLLDLCYGVIPRQMECFKSPSSINNDTLLQRFGEYWSKKRVVTYLSEINPDQNWTYPIPEATEPIKKIEERLTVVLEKEAREKYPVLTQEAYLKKGESLYPMFKKGAVVKFTLKQGGRGGNLVVKGKLLEVGKDRIKVAPRTIVNKDDMPLEMAARFFSDVHVKVVRNYAATAARDDDIRQKQHVRTGLAKQMPMELQRANYVPNVINLNGRISKQSFKSEEWLSRRVLVESYQLEYISHALGEENQKKPSVPKRFNTNYKGGGILQQYMNEHGFRFVTQAESERLGNALRQDEANPFVGWIPRYHIALMERKLRELAKYEKDMVEYEEAKKNYDLAMVQYEKDKKEFDRRLKEFEAAGGAAAGGGDEDE